MESDVKLIIVACNTASAAAIADLREAFPLPFVGMVPGLKPAVSSSPNRHVVILATEGTLDGDLYARVVDEFGRGTVIDNIPGTGLAELVEHGDCGTSAAHNAVRRVLAPTVAAGADTVVLGCTHYAFLGPTIRSEFPGIAVVDTSEAVARRAVQVLEENALEAPSDSLGELDLIVSGDRDRFRETMRRLGFAPALAEAWP